MMSSIETTDNQAQESTIPNMKAEVSYVGFWVRFAASVIDTIILIMITFPILFLIYGGEYFYSGESVQGWLDVIISYVFPILAIILFWLYKSATPGKIALLAKVADEKTGNKLSVKQALIRYVAYYISLLPLGLGFIWIAMDKKKQGWHDKLAGSVVIRVDTDKD